MSHAQLRNNTEKHHYELVDEGQVVGFVKYRLVGDAIRLVHTEIDPRHEGKGYGSALAKQVLAEMRAQNKQIVPVCKFIAGYIEKHPEYSDLIAQPK
jgi:predicted GNAT family acetyltransferase